MCELNSECNNNKFYDINACYECCYKKIKINLLLEEKVKNSWLQLLSKYKLALDNYELDRTFIIISYYIAIPNILLISFKGIMLEYFKSNNINVELLLQGKWLPSDLNISYNLIHGILVTQKFDNILKQDYKESFEFFLNKDKGLHRNRVAHDIISTLDLMKSIRYDDCFKHFLNICHFVLILSSRIDHISS